MKKQFLIAAIARGLAFSSTLAAGTAPTFAAAQSPQSPVAGLAAAIASAATGAESASQRSALNTADSVAAIGNAIERSVTLSGVEPAVALEALVAAQNNMRRDGTLTPAINAALNAVIARIRAAIAAETPGSVGGSAPFGAPPTGGGGSGGSDYRPA